MKSALIKLAISCVLYFELLRAIAHGTNTVGELSSKLRNVHILYVSCALRIVLIRIRSSYVAFCFPNSIAHAYTCVHVYTYTYICIRDRKIKPYTLEFRQISARLIPRCTFDSDISHLWRAISSISSRLVARFSWLHSHSETLPPSHRRRIIFSAGYAGSNIA